MTLAEQDREALHPCADSCESCDEELLEVVEQIVARHIEAFRAELVAAIEETANWECAGCDACTGDRQRAFLTAARIVATHQQPPTPPVASALRVEGGGGR